MVVHIFLRLFDFPFVLIFDENRMILTEPRKQKTENSLIQQERLDDSCFSLISLQYPFFHSAISSEKSCGTFF